MKYKKQKQTKNNAFQITGSEKYYCEPGTALKAVSDITGYDKSHHAYIISAGDNVLVLAARLYDDTSKQVDLLWGEKILSITIHYAMWNYFSLIRTTKR